MVMVVAAKAGTMRIFRLNGGLLSGAAAVVPYSVLKVLLPFENRMQRNGKAGTMKDFDDFIDEKMLAEVLEGAHAAGREEIGIEKGDAIPLDRLSSYYDGFVIRAGLDLLRRYHAWLNS